jgi:hypothetical protein
MPKPEDGLSTEIRVSTTPGSQFEQAGLIWYQNDSKYIKLVVELFNGERIINMVREENDDPIIFKQGLVDKISRPLAISFKGGKAVLIDKANNREAEVDLNKIPAKQIDLRLLQQSGEVIGQVKEAGQKKWKTVAKCPSFQDASLKAGLITLMGAKDHVRWVKFDKFVIRKLKF